MATELTEEALIEALQAKRFFSTADMNIDLTFSMNLAPMGSEIAAGSYGFAIAAGDGDAEIFTTVQLIKNGVVASEWTPSAADPELDGEITTVAGDSVLEEKFVAFSQGFQLSVLIIGETAAKVAVGVHPGPEAVPVVRDEREVAVDRVGFQKRDETAVFGGAFSGK